MDKLRPAPGHVMVLPFPDKEEKSGIILAAKTVRKLEPFQRAAVIEKGSPTKNYTMIELSHNSKPIVLYPRGIGTEVERDGVKYRLIHVSDIIAVISTDENK